MRIAMVFALCFLPSLICYPCPAAAQSSRQSAAALPVQTARTPRGTKTESVPLRIDPRNEPTNPQQSWMNLLPEQNEPSALQILPQVMASQCAYIVISQPRKMDSEMIAEVPRAFRSNMPTQKVLPPCSSPDTLSTP